MEDIKQIAERLSKDLEQIVKIFDKKLDEVPVELVPEINERKRDMKDALKKFKEGDEDGMKIIMKKYGDLHRHG